MRGSSIDNSQPGFEDMRNTRPAKRPLAKVEKTDFSIDENAYRDHQTVDNKSQMSHITAKTLRESEKQGASSIHYSEAPLYNTLANDPKRDSMKP